METPVIDPAWLISAAWLSGGERSRCAALARERATELADCEPGTRILLAAVDPVAFAAGMAAAWSSPVPVRLFLCSSAWGVADVAHVRDTVAPQRVWVEDESRARWERTTVATACASAPDESEFMIATGGTSGGVRFARHTRASLCAAADGLRTWAGGGALSSVCVLPLHHVSGCMQLVRAWRTRGAVALVAWREVEAGNLPQDLPERVQLSLVPTQLARLLERPAAVAWLRRFETVFLGGAAAWPTLLDAAREARVPLAPCYGMTETAAMIAATRPDEFLASAATPGLEALPHATPTIDADGRIRVRSTSLFLGYWGDDAGTPVDAGEFVTSDLGRIDARGRLHVLGRADGWITTGGEKVDPSVVENTIRASRLATDVAVVAVPDAEWGAIVVACVCGCDEGRLGELQAFVRARLSPHQIPKRWVRLAALPRNAAGKIDRRELTRLVATGESAP
ncbi:hypothetical protein ASA1KI_40700 [Opitutales bacterium ASA1]|uniref:AMP-binding protein n=1 Tax=Congregicoccus parvus TaxID=3081749 RepID=UPI002B2BD627|nr:hypothetical protein ASA1KI_40700 [Opitutales bacterium ASA1]